jgi:hypothetical protein
METLPNNIILNNIIIPFLIPYENVDFNTFLNYRLIDRLWCSIIDSTAVYKSIVSGFHIITNSDGDSDKKRIIQMAIATKKHLYDFRLIEIFHGFDKLMKLPVLYHVPGLLLDNMIDIWAILKRHMPYNLMRGVDTWGRHFIAIKYLNLRNNEEYVEILYNKKLNLNLNFWTYAGELNKCYIGSINIHMNPSRELRNDNYEMFYRIFSQNKCLVSDKHVDSSGIIRCILPYNIQLSDNSDSDSEFYDSDDGAPQHFRDIYRRKEVTIYY